MREHCVFTTHTPVPAGHDRFSMEQAYRILGSERTKLIERVGGSHDGLLNMTYIALRFARYVNGVAMQHGKVSREMFPDYTIDAITNAVHAATWTAAAFRAVFDRHIPRWREDNLKLRYAMDISESEIAEAHLESKRALIAAVKDRAGLELRPEIFTIGFARRAATYKRHARVYVLRQGQVQILGRTFTQTDVRAGPGYPHDLNLSILVVVKPKTLADGTLVRPIMTRRHFVHHGHARRICCIAFIEAAAAKYRHRHRIEESVAYDVSENSQAGTILGQFVALRNNVLLVLHRSHGDDFSESCRSYARQRAGAISQLLIKLQYLLILVARQLGVKAHHHKMVRAESRPGDHFGMESGLAIALTVVGLYGVMTYSISQRTREIGIRMALGAQRSQVLNRVMREGRGADCDRSCYRTARVAAVGLGAQKHAVRYRVA